MKYVKYILFVVAIILASCTIDEDVNNGRDNSSKFRLMSRIVPFEGYDVLTRAIGDGPTENDLLSLDYVMLAKLGEGNTSDDYRCIYYRHYGEDNISDVITIDVETDFKTLTTNLGEDALANCYIAVLANYPALYQKIVTDASGSGSVDEFIENNIVYKGKDGTYGQYKNSDYFTTIEQNIEAVSGVPTTGLPRLGNYKNPTTESGESGESGLIDLRSLQGGTTYEIVLESLYAKMVFDITVNPTQEIIGVDGNTFALRSFFINNLAQKIDMVGGTESAEGENDGTDDAVSVSTSPVLGDNSYIEVSSDRNVKFTCYLPERFTRAAYAANSTDAKTDIYPFNLDASGNVREEDEKLRQRYKPLLAQDDATSVTFEGIFVNHQGHSYDVAYTIYVGNDNYSNFDVVRNRQYNNYIVIKGIDNTSEQLGDNDETVSIDHRVDVQRTLPIIVNLRRETLLDAHFEVRPMRIRANTNHTGGTTQGTPAVQIEVEYNSDDPALTDPAKRWIGLERSFGGGTMPQTSRVYCIDGDVADDLGASSNGKRKYFTTDLTYGTLNKSLSDATKGELLYSNSDGDAKSGFSKAGGQTVIIPVHNNNINGDGMFGECVWIYVDECLEASSDLYSVRSAKIKVTNGYLNDSKQFRPGDEAPIYYTITQHRLYKVTYQGRTYYIEHEEEYLHNFDAYDNYDDNQTEFEGMEWGLYNTQLSFRNKALFFGESEETSGIIGWIIEYIETLIEDIINDAKDAAGLNPMYDFYVTKHDKSVSNKATKYPTTTVPQHGLHFTKNIVNDINGVTPANVTGYQGRNDRDDNIKVLQLNQLPHSAIEYCYNRNKRNYDGTITTNTITWYMPAIDEMEDVMMGANGQFLEFQSQFYWSCQPAFAQGYAHVKNFQYGSFLGYPLRENMEGDFYVDDIGIYAIDDDVFEEKNVGRARATRADFIGPDFDDFRYITSGISGYDNAYVIIGSKDNPDMDIEYAGTYKGLNDKSIPLYDWDSYPTVQLGYEDGNQLRSEKNRVRAFVDKTKVTEVD